MNRQAVTLLLLTFVYLTNAVKLTTSDASCILESAAASDYYQEGLVPFLRVKLYIHGVATFGSSSELQADTAWSAFNITNTSNGYKFFPRRATTTRAVSGSILTTFTFPLVEYSTQAGDIEISYLELPFQATELTVNTTVHVTSFTIPCTNVVAPYLYNAHVFGTVAEFLFTEPVVRCNDSTATTLSKDWLIYYNRACEAGADADDTQCVKTYPKTVSLCATDLKPVGGNTMRWWCDYHGNLTNGWTLETYFIQYALVSGVVCSAKANTTVKTFDTGGVKVFRREEDSRLVHPVLLPDTTNVGRSDPGIGYVDLQFQFPVNATLTAERIPVVRFLYYWDSKTARCNYYSNAGFPDGQILRYKCFPTIQLQVGDTPAVALIGTSITPKLDYYVLNYSATADSGVDFVNYTSIDVAPTTELDGVVVNSWSAITPTIEWIQAIYYINSTTLKLIPTRVLYSLPKRENIVCYDTNAVSRYDIVTTVRNGSTLYLSFSEDEPLPAYAADLIRCYFLYLTPSDDTGYPVFPANVVSVTLEPEGLVSAQDDSIFASVGYAWSIVLLILLLAFAVFGLAVLTAGGIRWYRTHDKAAVYEPLKNAFRLK